MDKQYESLYHDAETHNWWFAARRDMIKRWLAKYNIPKDAAIIDIGCAGGVLLAELMAAGYNNLTALDYSPEAIALCKERGITQAYVMDGHYPDFPDGSFDLVIASDSLEHLKDDAVALKSWQRILKKGGKAFIYVPAFMFLWSHHDEVNYHFRRYTRAGLMEKTTTAGFHVLKSGYWNFSLFFPTALMRLLSGKKKKPVQEGDGDIVTLLKPVNALLTGWIKIENAIGRMLPFPTGVSTFAIVEK